jgi:hypothetical protein
VNLVAIRLPLTLEISSSDEHVPCQFCLHSAADPDDLESWAAHLAQWHGYAISSNVAKTEQTPRLIQLTLIGWNQTRAKFAPNQRVTVKDEPRPHDYDGRRGIVVGWDAKTSQYAVAFSEAPTIGVFSSNKLIAFEPV